MEPTNLPTWDLFLTLFFVIGVAYSFLLQKDKVIVTLLSVYVALVLTSVLVAPIGDFFAGDRTILNQLFIKSSASPFTIATVVFALTIILVSTKSGLAGKDSGGALSPLELLGYSVLNTALILSSILFFMPEAQRDGFDTTSKIAHLLITYRLWILVLPVALLITTGFLHRSD